MDNFFNGMIFLQIIRTKHDIFMNNLNKDQTSWTSLCFWRQICTPHLPYPHAHACMQQMTNSNVILDSPHFENSKCFVIQTIGPIQYPFFTIKAAVMRLSKLESMLLCFDDLFWVRSYQVCGTSIIIPVKCKLPLFYIKVNREFFKNFFLSESYHYVVCKLSGLGLR